MGAIVKLRKWVFLSPRAKYAKTKGTLLSSTLKVDRKKCLYFFDLWPRGRDIAIFFRPLVQQYFVPSRPNFRSIMGIKHLTEGKTFFLTLLIFCELHKIPTTQYQNLTIFFFDPP